MVGPKRLSAESMSSLYLSDEEEGQMEVVELREGRKRGRVQEEENSCGEWSGEPAKVRREERQDAEEFERMSQTLAILQRKAKEEEARRRKREEEKEMERKAVKEQRRAREEERKNEREKEGKAEIIERIQTWTKKIAKAAERENAGKISVRREEQSLVRKGLYEIQNEMLDLIKITMRAEERARQAEEETRKYKEELRNVRDRMEGQSMKEDNDRRNGSGKSERQMAARRGEVESGEGEEKAAQDLYRGRCWGGWGCNTRGGGVENVTPEA